MNSVLMRAYIAPPDVDRFGLLMNQRRKLAKITSEIFGGCTITDGYGAWKDPDTGEMVMEDMFVVEVSFPKEYIFQDEKRDQWFAALNNLGLEWKQKSILYVTQEAQGNFWEVTDD